MAQARTSPGVVIPLRGPRRVTARPGCLSVIIPIHNEEDVLEHTVLDVLQGVGRLGLASFEIILCENGSSDATKKIAVDMARDQPHVRAILLEEADYGAALAAGFRAAAGEVIVTFDADYYDMTFVTRALGANAGIVVAQKHGDGASDERSFQRRLASRVFAWMCRRLLGVRVRETHGMKLFHVEAIASVLPDVRSTLDLFDTELVVRAERGGARIAMLPVRVTELRTPRTPIWSRVPRTIVGLIRLALVLRTEEHGSLRRIERYLPAA